MSDDNPFRPPLVPLNDEQLARLEKTASSEEAEEIYAEANPIPDGARIEPKPFAFSSIAASYGSPIVQLGVAMTPYQAALVEGVSQAMQWDAASRLAELADELRLRGLDVHLSNPRAPEPGSTLAYFGMISVEIGAASIAISPSTIRSQPFVIGIFSTSDKPAYVRNRALTFEGVLSTIDLFLAGMRAQRDSL